MNGARLTTLSIAVMAVALGGCGDDGEIASGDAVPPGSVLVGCDQGGTTDTALHADEQRASVVAGPLALVYARQYADHPPRNFRPTAEGLRDIITAPDHTAREKRLARRTLRDTRPGSYGANEMRVRLQAGTQATVTIPRREREAATLIFSRRARNAEHDGAPGAYRIADGDPSVTFRACPEATTEFLGAFVVAGARCLPLEITLSDRPQPVRRVLSFGAGDTCGGTAGARTVPTEAVLARLPYVGVACVEPNSIACDRVGVAVWLGRPAANVTARLAGRPVAMSSGGFGGQGATYWEGYLQPAGLIDGPLKVTPDRGRYHWEGSHPRDATVELTVRPADGPPLTTTATVPLHAGWG